MVADVYGGPGWVIRGADLRPAITDLEEFRRGIAADPLARALELLWSGAPGRALRALAAQEATPRVRALRADCLRDLGEAARAVAEYDRLLAEVRGTPREAVMRQHRGKALLAAGRPAQAQEDFERVVELRTGGDPALLASAHQALEFARRLAPQR